MNFKNFLSFYIDLWFITIPLTLCIVYVSVLEFLDLVLNTKKINKLIKLSDAFSPTVLEKQHETNLSKKAALDYSRLHLLESEAKNSIIPISFYRSNKSIFKIFKI